MEVRFVYVEFDPAVPPFMWLNGRALADDAHEPRTFAYRNLALMAGGRGRTAHEDGLRATRPAEHEGLLVEFALDGVDPEGRRLRATSVVTGELDRRDWLAECTRQVVDVLRSGDFTVDQGWVRHALEWGSASTAHRFPGLARTCRRLLRYLGMGRARAAFEPAGRA